MNDDLRKRDPLDPRDPAADPDYRDPRVVNQTQMPHPGSGRGGLAIAAVLAALLVIGFIAFTGNNEGVDPSPTAATGTDQEILPGTQPVTPDPTQPAEPPAAAPQPDESPAGAAPSE